MLVNRNSDTGLLGGNLIREPYTFEQGVMIYQTCGFPCTYTHMLFWPRCILYNRASEREQERRFKGISRGKGNFKGCRRVVSLRATGKEGANGCLISLLRWLHAAPFQSSPLFSRLCPKGAPPRLPFSSIAAAISLELAAAAAATGNQSV